MVELERDLIKYCLFYGRWVFVEVIVKKEIVLYYFVILCERWLFCRVFSIVWDMCG